MYGPLGLQQESSEVHPPRLDVQMQQKVVALASRLQMEHQDTLTASQIEAAAAEVGLEPVFVRRAITQLTTVRSQASLERAKRKEFWSMACALAFPLAWGLITYQLRSYPDAAVSTFMTLIAPAPLAGLLGFLSGRKASGLLAGITLALALAPSFSAPNLNGLGYAFFGAPVGAALGVLGAHIREEYFGRVASEAAVSPAELIGLLSAAEAPTPKQPM